MQKNHFIATFFLLISSICAAQSFPPDACKEAKRLNGKFKSVRSSLYNAVELDGKIVAGKKITGVYTDCTSYYYQYNKNGKPIETIEIGTLDDIISETSSQYNKQGQKVEELEISSENNFGINSVILWVAEYNRDGKCKKTFTYDASSREKPNLDRYDIFKYDEDGNVLYREEYRICYDTPQLTHTEQYTYDKNNNLLKHIGEEVTRVYEYDSFGNKTKEEEYRNGKLEWCTNYQYDQKGERLLEAQKGYKDCSDTYLKTILVYHEDGSYEERTTYFYSNLYNVKPREHHYIYDNKHNRLSSVWYEDGSIIEKKEYEYDNFNNLTLESYNENNPPFKSWVIKKQYTYDQHHNWIQLIDFRFDKETEHFVPNTIEIREILYYD